MTLTIAFAVPRKKQEATDFGSRLVALRKARGMTQVQLAEATGTSQRAISYYENHASFPPAQALIALAQALRVSTDELLGVRAPKRESADPEQRRLWKKFQQVGELPERDQRAVIRLINSLSAASAAEGRSATR